MRVKMYPELRTFGKGESGIKRVVEAYYRYAGDFGIQYVSPDEDCDIVAIHAGTSSKRENERPLFSLVHGLYFTADYAAQPWEYEANRNVISTVRCASGVSVPSRWVQEIFERDMRIRPYIIPHGIDWQEWQGNYENLGYVLWNKNRAQDTCDPRPVGELAKRMTDIPFVTTFANAKDVRQNIRIIGLQSHPAMKRIVQSAAVYLSTTKETMGIGTLEAMAAGIPVLGFSHGGNLDTVVHGVNGYLAKSGDFDELAEGLSYCLLHRSILGENGREMAKTWTWQKQIKKLAEAFEETIQSWNNKRRPHIIPPELYLTSINTPMA